MAEDYEFLRKSCAAADALRQAINGNETDFPIVQQTIDELDNQRNGNPVYCTGSERCPYNTRRYCNKRVDAMLAALTINKQLVAAPSEEVAAS